MNRQAMTLLFSLFLAACGQVPGNSPPGLATQLGTFEHLPGYFDLYWDADKGRLLVEIDELDQAFLYQSSMARGVGSNDLGLDRGQLGATRVVRFSRSGPKVLMI